MKSISFLHDPLSTPVFNTNSTVVRFVINLTEGLLYLYMLYSNLGASYGYDVPYLGIIWLAVLAGLACFINTIHARSKIHIYLIAVFAISYGLIQVYIFDVSLDLMYAKAPLIGFLLALVVDVLLTRPGFLKRLIMFIFGFVLFIWPSIIFRNAGQGMVRAWGEGISFSNPDFLGAYLGFCAMGFWLWGLSQEVQARRWLLWGSWSDCPVSDDANDYPRMHAIPHDGGNGKSLSG